jgi:hypothetical protein
MKEWTNVMRIRVSGVPILGFTWYSLTDQVDWDCALRENRGTVNPLGLYDLDRNIRPVGRAYKKLIADWTNLLEVQTNCLALPVYNPSEQEYPLIIREQAQARAKRLALGRVASPLLHQTTINPNTERPPGSLTH